MKTAKTRKKVTFSNTLESLFYQVQDILNEKQMLHYSNAPKVAVSRGVAYMLDEKEKSNIFKCPIVAVLRGAAYMLE